MTNHFKLFYAANFKNPINHSFLFDESQFCVNLFLSLGNRKTH